MRNLITLVEGFDITDQINSQNKIAEDLAFGSISKGKIVLDDPENDEVEALAQDSSEKKTNILKDVSRDMHEDVDDGNGEMGSDPIDETVMLDESAELDREIGEALKDIFKL